VKIPRYGVFARFKDSVKGWRDGTRHRPRVSTMADVAPAGYWETVRQLPGRYYAEIDREANRLAGPFLARIKTFKHQIDLLQVQINEQQNKHPGPTDDPHLEFQFRARLNGLRTKLLSVLRDYEECRVLVVATERRAQATKQKAYEYAKERFAVYLGKLTNHHRFGDLIRLAVQRNYAELGPQPPTESVLADYTTPTDEGP